MRGISTGELSNLINKGFKGKVHITGDIILHGEGRQIAAYSGGLFLKQDFSFEEYDRYEAISEDTKFHLFFARAKKAELIHPSESTDRISIPIRLPKEHYIFIDNLKEILY